MLRALATITALSLMLTHSAPARAVEVGTDEVRMKDGSSFRGTVLVDDGTRVVIRIYGTEEPRELRREEILSVTKDKYSAALRPLRSRVQVKVDSDGESDAEATLFERTPLGEPRAICTVPCETEILAGDGRKYFVGGEEMPDSADYYPSPDLESVVLRTGAGSDTLTDIGTGLGVPGVALGAASFTLAVVFFAASPPEEKITTEQWAAWGVVSGIALPLMIGGVVFVGLGATHLDEVEVRTPRDNAPQQARAPRYWMGEF